MGDFDCINQQHLHLIKEMRKLVIPSNEIAVVLMDDYASFVTARKFPIQDIHRRANNLMFFLKNIKLCFNPDPSLSFGSLIDDAKAKGLQPIFVTYDDDKDFQGRMFLKEHNVPVRFIKKPNAKT